MIVRVREIQTVVYLNQPSLMSIVPLLNRLHHKGFTNVNQKINIILNLNGNVIPEEFATIVSVMCVAAVLFKST